jgi:hypothetical protein
LEENKDVEGFEPPKESEIVMEDVEGEEQRGVVVFIGKKGHHEISGGTSSILEQKKCVDDGAQRLSKLQIDNKYKLLSMKMSAYGKKQNDHAVENRGAEQSVGQMSVDALLSMIGSSAKIDDASGDGSDQGEQNESEVDSAGGDVEEVEASDEEGKIGEGDATLGFLGLSATNASASSGGSLPTGGPTMTHSSTQKQSGSATRRKASPKRAAEPKPVPPPTKRTSPKVAPPGAVPSATNVRVVAQLDGRGNRLKESSAREIAALKERVMASMPVVAYTILDEPTMDDTGATNRQLWLKDLQRSSKALRAVDTALKTLQNRLKASTSAVHFEVEHGDISNLIAAVTAQDSLNKMVILKNPNHTEYLDNYATVMKHRDLLGSLVNGQFNVMKFRVKVVGRTMVGDYNGFAQMFVDLSPDLHELRTAVGSASKAEADSTKQVEDMALGLASKSTPSKKASCAQLLSCLSAHIGWQNRIDPSC